MNTEMVPLEFSIFNEFFENIFVPSSLAQGNRPIGGENSISGNRSSRGWDILFYYVAAPASLYLYKSI
jgi:hypothetical protein